MMGLHPIFLLRYTVHSISNSCKLPLKNSKDYTACRHKSFVQSERYLQMPTCTCTLYLRYMYSCALRLTFGFQGVL